MLKRPFLKGVTYQELADLTGEAKRDVNFEVKAETAEILRTIPGFSTFDHKKNILRNLKPRTGTKDAPRCFGLKLKQATLDGFGANPTTHDSQLIVKHTNQSELELVGAVHVDDIKTAYPSENVFDNDCRT